MVEKKRISLSIDDLFSKFRVSGNFLVAPLTLEVVEEAARIKLMELHDRIVVATDKLFDAVLITNDKEIIASGLVEILWE